MVWNVTKDEIRTRLAVVDYHTWGPPPARKSLPGDLADRRAWAKELGLDSLDYSDFISEGKMDVSDVPRSQAYGVPLYIITDVHRRGTSSR